MLLKRNFWFFSPLIFIILIAPCGKGRDSYVESKKVRETVPFPHPDGWSAKQEHGLTAINLGKDSCSSPSCHGEDLSGGYANIACDMCHSTYPHGDGWITQGQHWQQALAVGTAKCAGCHGEDFTGADTGVSCFGCHTLYPHEDDWISSTHGDYVNANGDSECISCHDDLRSGISLDPASFPNCQYCH